MPSVLGAEWLLQAFYELCTVRTYTMAGAASIPLTAIWEWKDRNSAPSWFPEVMLSIDSKFLESFSGRSSPT
jgi:hypothetical protein